MPKTTRKSAPRPLSSPQGGQQDPAGQLARMLSLTMRQFTERAQDWDAQVAVWQYFDEVALLPTTAKVALSRMLKCQGQFLEFIHDCPYPHMDYCTSAAIPYELLSCHALLMWAAGAITLAKVCARLRACNSFYVWAMTPPHRRSSRVAAQRTINREFMAIEKRLKASAPRASKAEAA